MGTAIFFMVRTQTQKVRITAHPQRRAVKVIYVGGGAFRQERRQFRPILAQSLEHALTGLALYTIMYKKGCQTQRTNTPIMFIAKEALRDRSR
jgi:hypothetical protein